MTQRPSVFWLATMTAALSSIVGCSGKGSASAGIAPRVVQVTRVQFSGMDNTLRGVGLLSPKDEMRLSFKVAGLIESVGVEEGRTVKAGQVLAVLKQAEMNASLEQTRQAATKARRDLDRGKALLADGVATEEQVQDLTTAFTVAGAALRGMEFNAAHSRIIASADGVVLRKLAEANELVTPGQTVLILGGAARGWVARVGLADRDAVRTRIGDEARVEFDAWPGQIFRGHVSNISSAADSATGTFTVEVQVAPGSTHFVQGLIAKVSITPQGSAQVKVIPLQALLEANDKEAGVFVLDEAAHDVHRVSIQIGRMSAGDIEVLDGLAPDAQVVTAGAAFLSNGEKVRVLN